MNVAAIGAQVFEFGPAGAYLGYISDPSRPRSRTGVILLGLGRRESRIARRLAALGITVMQIRLFRNFDDLQARLRFYDASGVAACRHAIDEFMSRRPVTEVALLGDCAEGNISFNTTLADPRVVALVLSNPNVKPSLTFVDRLPQRLFSVAAWRRLLAGDSRVLKSVLHRLGSDSAGEWLAEQRYLRKDVVLPPDFDQKLSWLLTERAVRSLVLFSHDTTGLRRFQKNCGGILEQLRASGRFTFQVLPADAHDEPTDDGLAGSLADVVAEWAGRELVTRPAQRIDAGAPQETPVLPASAVHATINERFEAIVRLHAARVAIRDEARCLTYAQLATEAHRIAAAVASAATDPGPVAVLLGHEARFSAAILGVWAAGRVCVPLDADHPAERNARIAAHSGATLLVSTADLAANARALFPSVQRVIDLDDIEVRDACPPVSAPGPDDIACVIYTSGSTGTPKGVFQNHRGVLQDVLAPVSFANLRCDDRVSLFYPPSVIAGLRVMLLGLMHGAALEVLPPRRFGRTALAAEIRARGVTTLNASPTLFRHLADTLPAGACFDDVRRVTLGGERVDWNDYDVFRRACPPHAELCVHLGATECWTLHTEWKVDPSVRPAGPRLPSGRAIRGRQVDIVGEDGRTVPAGQMGEAVVTSRYIALGYWREPGLTAQAFTVDPADPRVRSYRTGDLVRRRPDGLVEFAGRKDNQIKLHGYRIEPNEVESALKACAGVRNAAVLVRRDAAGEPLALAGYVEAEASLTADRIQAMLRERLPPYMMPAEIRVLDELPWLPNFKIDRQRLAQIDAGRSTGGSHTEDSPLIGELIAAFEQVTRSSGAKPTDNLRSLGGDSLHALELMLEIGRRFRVVVPEQAQDPTRTISQWARDIAAWRSLDAARWTE